MVTKGTIKKGEYFDSVSIMMIAKRINELEGVLDSAIVMGTKENKSILNTSKLLIPKFKSAEATDLLIVVKAENDKFADEALKTVARLFKEKAVSVEGKQAFVPKSFENALKIMPEANLSLISITGKYAYDEAMKALINNIHVMIFSDNVPIEREIELKKYARRKGLLVMGPDCGTAIVNNTPLGFANIVNRGDIGIVAASGTGLQEISSIISNEGCGISQAIGTGGRDVKKEVGGIMFIEGIRALAEDSDTKVILLVSKPPHKDVLKMIGKELININKPVIAIFLGVEHEIIKGLDVIPAQTLEECALTAVSLSKGTEIDSFRSSLEKRDKQIKKIAEGEARKQNLKQKYIRGLFSGGTLCDEAQVILEDLIGDVYSNTPLRPEKKLRDSWESYKHTVLDLGCDEFTVGRPHPMIDYSLRIRKLLEEVKDEEVAIILLDIVLGYGSNMNPAEELAPIIRRIKTIAKTKKRHLSIICSITGTQKDLQNRKKVEDILKGVHVIVMPTNAAACKMAGYITLNLGIKNG